MDRLVIEGGIPLKGKVCVGGSKNSVLPLFAASLLTDKPCRIRNVPNLKDVSTMIRILRSLGAQVEFSGGEVSIEAKNIRNHTADYKLVSTMRASFCVLGALLGRLHKAKVSLPGGCVIGVRPVDLHLKGIRALGARVEVQGGYVEAWARELTGATMYLGGVFGSSVLATGNVMMAAVLAKGRTVIESAACEPEVIDLANFLNEMGAKIKGQGTPRIEIEGVKSVGGADYKVATDRIEAGTLILASAITKGDCIIEGALKEHLGALLDKLSECGVRVEEIQNGLRVRPRKVLRAVSITTLPYPGFPTDMQAQMMSLMSVTPGISIITEKIYPDRFMHIAELNRMGASIMREGPHAVVEGKRQLSGAEVMASDLRASAALVLAGLVAKGRTTISRVYHLDRGYENLEVKLQGLGARIWREKE